MIIENKNFLVVMFFAVSLLIFSFFASAETTTSPTTDSTETIAEEQQKTLTENNQDNEAQLSIGAGITPDSPFYFIEDKILTQFRDEVENREKKIAEIEEMVKEGKIDSAREALERYNKYASELENEVDPDKSDEAKRSASAIRNKIKEIESKVPEDAKKDFIKDIEDREKRISTAAELSKKIRDLCEALSKVDPVEYGRVCKTSDGAPKWQKNLDKRLTEEQRKEAEKFFKIMSACFKDPATCKCEEISVDAFAEKCSVVAPLAAKCESGDEKACEEMDEKSEGIDELLPEHLQEVMVSVEEKYGEAKRDLYMPPECRDAGVRNPKECEKIVIRTHAPEECIDAVDRGEISFENPRQFEKVCQEIMFKLNAPEECVNAGLKDPKECGKLMFKLNAPEECVNAGLTGGSRSDEKKCREIMESAGQGGRSPGHGQGFALGRDCKAIENKDEKLKCFEDMFSNAQEHYGFQGGPREGPEGAWPEPCQRAKALTKESCEKVMTEESKKRFEDTRRYEEEFARSCREKGGRWDCGFGSVAPGNSCRCFFDDQFRPPQGQFPTPQQPPTEFQCPPDMTKKCEGDNRCFCQPPEQQIRPPTTQPTQPPTTETTTPSPPTSPTTEAGSQTGATGEQQTQTGTSTSTGTSDASGSGTSPGGTTGKMIGIDNDFLEYYFK